MEGSQWHRYPSSTYFDLWIEAKLSNPDSLFVFNTPKPDRKTADGKCRREAKSSLILILFRAHSFSGYLSHCCKEHPESSGCKLHTSYSYSFLKLEVKEKLCSLLKAKPLHIFLSDPLGYRCFEKYLNTSKIGFEYIEFLNFWNDV